MWTVMDKQNERLAIRIPEEMKEDWRRRAHQQNRSLSNWIVYIIEKYKELES